jgi:hypothetical protein
MPLTLPIECGTIPFPFPFPIPAIGNGKGNGTPEMVCV